MARNRTRRTPHSAFDALTVEGALIAPAMLARIAEQKAGGQAEADYSVPKGLTLRDEIARYFRIGQALFRELAASATPSHAATTRFRRSAAARRVRLCRCQPGRHADASASSLSPSPWRRSAGACRSSSSRPSDDLDAPSTHLPSEGRRRSAASALQDWLNASDGALWGLCCNGVQLRLVRDNASLTRPAFIEADLRRIFEGEAFADFAALWLLDPCEPFRRGRSAPTDCALERWREAGGKEGRRRARSPARRRRGGALEPRRRLPRPSRQRRLARAPASGALPLPDFFGQLLRLVYRLIFLLAAEDREPAACAGRRRWRRGRLYAEGYSVGALRDRAVRRAAWDRHHDRWEGLLIAFAALARGEPRLGLPALGGLFEPGTIPDLEARPARQPRL